MMSLPASRSTEGCTPLGKGRGLAMVLDSTADAAESQAKILKHNYAQACQACHDSHARCDLGRPCSRCIKRQTMTTCADMVYACTDLLLCKLAVLLLLLLLCCCVDDVCDCGKMS